jgi:hypothetical protein
MEDPAAPRSDGVLCLVVRPLTRLPTGRRSAVVAARRLVPDDASGTSFGVGQTPLAASAAGRRTRIRRIAIRSIATILVMTAASPRRSVPTPV